MKDREIWSLCRGMHASAYRGVAGGRYSTNFNEGFQPVEEK